MWLRLILPTRPKKPTGLNAAGCIPRTSSGLKFQPETEFRLNGVSGKLTACGLNSIFEQFLPSLDGKTADNKITLLRVIPTMTFIDLLLANLLAFYLTYLLAFYLAYLLAIYLAYFLAYVLAYLLAFCLEFHLAYLLAYLLTSYLAFYLANLLAFNLANILALYLAYLLAFYLAFYLAYLLAFYLAYFPAK